MIINSTFLVAFLAALSYKNSCLADPVAVADPYFGAIAGFVGSAVSGAAGLVGSAADAVVGGVKAGAEVVGSAVGTGVSTVGQGVGSAVTAVGQGVGVVGNVAGQAVSGAGSLVGGAASAVGNVAGGAVQAVGDGISTVTGAVAGETVGNIIGGAVSGVGSVITGTTGLAGGIVEGGAGLAGSVVDGTIGGAGSAISTAGTITQAGAQLAGGVITVLPKLIPLPSDLFRLSFELLIGVPSATLFNLLNTFCSAAVTSETLESKYVPDIDKIKFELHTRDSDKKEVKTSVPIKDAGSLFSNSNFNKSYKTVILATGWRTSLNDTNNAMELIKDGYLCRGGYNFIVVDASDFLLTLYTWSALNTAVIGQYVGLGVKNLVDSGYPLENINLVGHSLGAHIVGSAGKYFFSQTNKFIHRITGLDPALPCFNEGENLDSLDRGDALFVDVIHSNPGGLGQRSPVGDADYYPNGFSMIQPGCLDPTCSHGRAYEYFAETIYPGNENGFMAVRCSSLTKLESDFCKSAPVPMGFAAIRDIKGNFFLRTRSSSPYGLQSTAPSSISCPSNV